MILKLAIKLLENGYRVIIIETKQVIALIKDELNKFGDNIILTTENNVDGYKVNF
jgi:hypothetical protein